MLLPDINLWLALTFEVHSHHLAAAAWFEGVDPGGSAFCRLTQQGYLRLATNTTVFKDEAVTMARAWSCYDQLLTDQRVRFVDEPTNLEAIWRRLTARRSCSPKVWNDSYLAAFVCAGDLELVTFDRGFAAYSGAAVTILPTTG